MAMPVQDFTEDGRRSASWLKSSTGRNRWRELDSQIDTQIYKERAVLEMNEARSEEIVNIQDSAYHQKQALNRNIVVLKNQLLQIENVLSRVGSVADKVDAEKKKVVASRELKQKEQSLRMKVGGFTKNAWILCYNLVLYTAGFSLPGAMKNIYLII